MAPRDVAPTPAPTRPAAQSSPSPVGAAPARAAPTTAAAAAPAVAPTAAAAPVSPIVRNDAAEPGIPSPPPRAPSGPRHPAGPARTASTTTPVAAIPATTPVAVPAPTTGTAGAGAPTPSVVPDLDLASVELGAASALKCIEHLRLDALDMEMRLALTTVVKMLDMTLKRPGELQRVCLLCCGGGSPHVRLRTMPQVTCVCGQCA